MKPHLLTALLVLLASASICGGQDGRTAMHAERQQKDAENIPERNPYTWEADIEAGQKLFVRRCAHCHSVHGEGGRGVNLTTGRYRLGGSDRQLFSTLRNGIPDSEMPGSRAAAIEIWRLVGYVKRLGAPLKPRRKPKAILTPTGRSTKKAAVRSVTASGAGEAIRVPN